MPENMISPCHAMFDCPQRFGDKDDCAKDCAKLMVYRQYLTRYPLIDNALQEHYYDLCCNERDAVGLGTILEYDDRANSLAGVCVFG